LRDWHLRGKYAKNIYTATRRLDHLTGRRFLALGPAARGVNSRTTSRKDGDRMNPGEFHELLTEEGRVRFIAQYTGLDADRVLRIDRLGQPWPFTEDEAWDFGRQAEDAGMDIVTFMVGLAPLLTLDVEQKKAKFLAFEQQALAQGNVLTPAQLTELEAEIGDIHVLSDHLEQVANITGEPLEIVMKVCEGCLAVVDRLGELNQEVTAAKRKEELERGGIV
jgi:hypothetical protein